MTFDGDQHIVPNFGRKHESSSSCWCRPSQHNGARGIWLHSYRRKLQTPSVMVDGETETLQ